MPALKISGQAVKVNYQPQTDFDFGERYELNKEVDLAPYINKNGWGLSTFAKYTLTNAEGQELVRALITPKVAAKSLSSPRTRA